MGDKPLRKKEKRTEENDRERQLAKLHGVVP
jgi:hypothetical protein